MNLPLLKILVIEDDRDLLEQIVQNMSSSVGNFERTDVTIEIIEREKERGSPIKRLLSIAQTSPISIDMPCFLLGVIDSLLLPYLHRFRVSIYCASHPSG